MLIEICEYKNNNKTLTQKELADIFHVSIDTIRKYLNDGGANIKANSWVSFESSTDARGHVVFVEGHLL